MALILTVATSFGVHVSSVVDSHLAEWRVANAFASDGDSTDTGEPRYSLVVRAGGEPLVEDETTLGVLKLSAGPLRFDVALYDECQLRSENKPAEDSSYELDHSDRVITVFVDPEEEALAEDCQQLLDEHDPMSPVEPVWVLLPPIDAPTAPG